jgi:hypothetical protein
MGEVVLRLSGRLVSTDELGRLMEHACRYLTSLRGHLTIYEGAHLVWRQGS